MTWTNATVAETASEAARIVCCGNPNCFDGRGCQTARWWTERMIDQRYQLVEKEPAMSDETTP